MNKKEEEPKHKMSVFIRDGHIIHTTPERMKETPNSLILVINNKEATYRIPITNILFIKTNREV